MVTSDTFGDKRLDDALAAGHAALDEGLIDEAIDFFKVALRRGTNTPEREALIRCGLSEAFERRGEGRDQLEAISKYDNFPDFVRLPERTQMRVLIRLGWAHSVNNEIPRAIALFNRRRSRDRWVLFRSWSSVSGRVRDSHCARLLQFGSRALPPRRELARTG